MKFTVFSLLALTMVAQTAFAQRHGHHHDHWRYHGCRDVWGNRVPCDGVEWTYTVSCSPEVVSNNVQSADQVLASLAAGELKANKTFTAKINEIAGYSTEKKVDAYMDLAGVNSKDAEAVLNFIYAREASASNVLAAQKNLDLNADQASLVINKLTEALKPQN